MNIGIVTVGIGTFVDRQLLSSITSYPTNRNMFVVPSVRNVTGLANDIKRIVCSGEIGCVIGLLLFIFTFIIISDLCKPAICIHPVSFGFLFVSQ